MPSESAVVIQEENFLPIDKVKELTSDELEYLQSCRIRRGYYDSVREEFIVETGGEKKIYLHGRGVCREWWTLIT